MIKCQHTMRKSVNKEPEVLKKYTSHAPLGTTQYPSCLAYHEPLGAAERRAASLKGLHCGFNPSERYLPIPDLVENIVQTAR